jgi:hypothetical protein
VRKQWTPDEGANLRPIYLPFAGGVFAHPALLLREFLFSVSSYSALLSIFNHGVLRIPTVTSARLGVLPTRKYLLPMANALKYDFEFDRSYNSL